MAEAGVGQQGLAVELTALVLERTAPEEVPELDEVAAEYFADPRRALGGRGGEPLGFGVDLALLAPYALAVATPVISYLWGIAVDIIKDGLRDGLTDAVAPQAATLVRRLFRRPAAPPPAADAPALTPAQLHEVRTRTLDQAAVIGIPAEQATLLANAVAGSLVVRG